MPNHVKNIVVCENIKELDIYGVNENGNKTIEFNKIIPMPPELENSISPVNDIALLAYEFILNHVGVNFKLGKDRGMDIFSSGCAGLIKDTIVKMRSKYSVNTLYYDHNYYLKHLRNKTAKGIEELFFEAINAISIHDKYGYFNWYDWRVANWGTKWDAYEFKFEGDDTISFWTAWSPPIKVYDKLFEIYPELDFTITYAEEQANGLAGTIMYSEGVSNHIEHISMSQEALQAYVHTWGMDDFIGTNDDGSYFYNEDCCYELPF